MKASRVLLVALATVVVAPVHAHAAPLAPPATHQQTSTASPAPGNQPAVSGDEAELLYAMERAETELKRSPLLVRDPALNGYVRGVACKVAGDQCANIRVYIVDVPQFNASMAPNGMLVLWTGALLRMRNEAELAYVLGHEIGHYTARHSLQQWRRLKSASAWMSVFQLVAYGAGAGGVAQLGTLAGSAALFKYSRDMEREADRLGFASVVSHRWAPHAGADLWARMWREEQTRKYDRPLTLFSTHPASQERLNDIKAASMAMVAPPTDLGRERYRAAVHPLFPKLLEEELAQRRYAGSILVIGELLEDAPTEDQGLLTFSLGEAYRRRGLNDDRAKAADFYARAIALPGAPAQAWREYGFTRRDAGDTATAMDALRRYLRDAPDADDQAFIRRELEKIGGSP
ncbi:MAG: M48 family metalloprotease [Thermomonas sp.]|uniref:M48 family metallopeptidase n=1 Tax=Thermomonas sp. TaxID=1971895 RepID=UPI002611ADC0|nr:M48 family metallopeptidase [Thermomonas sp.]MCC7097507.1 M48 family metalloprotease [Thermomonas sp.]